MNDLVSVVVPVYNVEPFLKKCIDTIINQTYTNLEIILVDDGSTDLSGQICDEYKKIDKRIKVIHKDNSGLGLSRNVGIKASKGKYITFIDSDDYISNNMILNLVNGIKKKGADACIGGFVKIDGDEREIFTEKYNDIFLNKNILEHTFIKMLGNLPNSHDSIKMSVWGCLFSTNLIKENDIYFKSERVYISEDIVWDSYFYDYAKSVQFINKSGYFYRLNNNSLTTSYKKERFTKSIFLYEKLEERIKKLNKYSDEALLRAQKQLLINVKACVVQENVNNIFNSIKNIKRIVNNSKLRIILNEYPIQKLPFKPKIFAKLVLNRNILILSVISRLSI
ncbi:glycosyltransferase [Limosilactobacillus reuteri subsp. suis]|uniref:glycosyltransferase n=2 Tax=Limosilactobacillus reuteri TaxID=1598 RepID=UPI0015E85CA1|nr:glycosyltransferase [Limosilactobacillus reuteri]